LFNKYIKKNAIVLFQKNNYNNIAKIRKERLFKVVIF